MDGAHSSEMHVELFLQSITMLPAAHLWDSPGQLARYLPSFLFPCLLPVFKSFYCHGSPPKKRNHFCPKMFLGQCCINRGEIMHQYCHQAAIIVGSQHQTQDFLKCRSQDGLTLKLLKVKDRSQTSSSFWQTGSGSGTLAVLAEMQGQE